MYVSMYVHNQLNILFLPYTKPYKDIGRSILLMLLLYVVVVVVDDVQCLLYKQTLHFSLVPIYQSPTNFPPPKTGKIK